MSRRKKRLTIDDLLPGRTDDSFVLDQNKKTGKVRIKKKGPKLPHELRYPVFFRLIKDNPFMPDPVEEFKFHPVRKWRVDICWPDQKLAVEIEGGVWSCGRHIHPTGFMNDKEKYNMLSIFGYHLLRFTPQEIESCEAYDVIREWFKNNCEYNATIKKHIKQNNST